MKVITCVICLLSVATVLAQPNTSYLHNRYSIERIGTLGSNSNGVPILPSTPPKTEGDVYLTKTFNLSVFELYDQRILEGFVSKLDLKLNEFDIITQNGLKALKGNIVRSFVSIDSVTQKQFNFVNIREWRVEDNPAIEGFFQILSDGGMTLAKRTELIFKKADFNPALNLGSKDSKYIKKDQFYFIVDQIAKPMPGKRNLSKIFGQEDQRMKLFLEKENINPNNERDLVRLFSYFNEFKK